MLRTAVFEPQTSSQRSYHQLENMYGNLFFHAPEMSIEKATLLLQRRRYKVQIDLFKMSMGTIF